MSRHEQLADLDASAPRVPLRRQTSANGTAPTLSSALTPSMCRAAERQSTSYTNKPAKLVGTSK